MATVTIPATLNASDTVTGTTATVDGSSLDYGAGQVAVFTVQASTPGVFRLSTSIDAPFGGVFTVTLDGAPLATLRAYGLTEEEEQMPAHTTTETSFTAASGATATRADLPGSRDAPANRYRVRIINTHTDDRLYVGRSQAFAQGTAGERVDANGGIWEDTLDANCQVWVRPAGSNSIVVGIVQYATA